MTSLSAEDNIMKEFISALWLFRKQFSLYTRKRAEIYTKSSSFPENKLYFTLEINTF